MISGIIGYMVFASYSFFEALYMVVVTITSIDYQEVKPVSSSGRAFNIFLIITSFSTFTYVLARATQYIASGEMAAQQRSFYTDSALLPYPSSS